MAGETGATTDRLLNKLQYAVANKAATGTTLATGDLILAADVSADYKVVASTPGEIVAGFGVTATAAQINAAAAGTRGVVSVTDAATYTVLAADSGKTHILPNFTASCTLTLPTAAAGLEYTFIGKAVAADAQNWVFASPSATNFYLGGIQFADTDEPASPALLTSVFPNGTTNDNMTIVTPSAGTYINIVCDGTNWIVNGQVFSATVPTFGD